MCDVKMSLMCNFVVNRKCRSESESRQEEEGDPLTFDRSPWLVFEQMGWRMWRSCYVELWEIIPSDQVIFIQRPGGSPWKMLSKKWAIGF